VEAHKRVCFNGDNYSQEWVEEAERRGLANAQNTPEALAELTSDKNRALFQELGVLSSEELEARANILTEDYVLKVCVEARVLSKMVRESVVPAAIAEQTVQSAAVIAVKSALGGEQDNGVDSALKAQRDSLFQLTGRISTLLDSIDRVEAAETEAHQVDDLGERAFFCLEHIIPEMVRVREACDGIERTVAAERWPLPTYHQMLFEHQC
jgi:glutamine synthetase